jgi:hypothetical protein
LLFEITVGKLEALAQSSLIGIFIDALFASLYGLHSLLIFTLELIELVRNIKEIFHDQS